MRIGNVNCEVINIQIIKLRATDFKYMLELDDDLSKTNNFCLCLLDLPGTFKKFC